jgi:hypothetical protein
VTGARIKRIAELDTRLSIAAAELHCAIRDGARDFDAREVLELQDAERAINQQLDRMRNRLRAELDAANQEQYPQQPGRTA